MLALLKHDFFRLLGGSAYVFIFRIMGAASVYLTQVVIARWLGAEALGAYVYAFSWLIMLAVVSGFGFPAASFRFIGHALAHGENGKLWGFIVRGRQFVLGGSLLAAGCAALGVVWFDGLVNAEYRTPLLIAIATAPLMAMIIYRTAIAQAFSWFDIAVIPNDALRPLVFLLILGVAWWGGQRLDINEVLLLQLGVMGFFTILIEVLFGRRMRKRVVRSEPVYETKLWLRTASPLLIIVLFSGFFSEVNMIIVGSYLPADQLAMFNASFRTAFMIGFGITAVDSVTLPKAARLYAAGDMEALQRLITHATHMKFWGALAAIVLFVLFGRQILSIFGPGFDQAYGVLVILGVAMVVIAGNGAVTELLSISGHQDHCLYVFLSAFALTLILHSLTIPRYGLEGAAWSVLAVVSCYSIWLHWLVIRKLGILPSIFGVFWLRKNAPVAAQ
jgi:O-antigen/teichoic acid export membrane protein